MSQISRSITAVALCILLASCGGGNDGNGTPATAGTNSSSGLNQALTPIEPNSTNTGSTTGGTSPNTGSSENNAATTSPANTSINNTNPGTVPPTDAAGGNVSPGAASPSGSSNGTSSSGTNAPTFVQDPTARFNSPSDVAVDNAGNVYVMDIGNKVIRRIASTGEVTTLPGTYDSGRPLITMDRIGNLFVLDTVNIYKVSPVGNRTLIMTYPAEAGSTQAIGISADAQGQIYVLVNYRTRFWVHQIDPNNPPEGIFWGDGAGAHRSIYSISTFGDVTGIATDAQGNLAVSTSGPLSGTSDIRYVPRSVQPVEEPSSAITRWPVQLSNPTMVFGRNGQLYVVNADYSYSNGNPVSVSNVRLLRIAPDGTSTTILSGFPDRSTSRQTFSSKKIGIAVAANGDVYFADPFVHAIYRIGANGQTTVIAGKEGDAGNSD